MIKIISEDKIRKYRDYLVNEEKSRNTVLKYIRDVTAFSLWLSGRQLNKAAVLEYKEHLKSYLSSVSVNSVLSSLNSFFEYCNCCECRVKMIKIQKQIFASEEKDLTIKEYDRLLRAAKEKGDQKLYLLTQTIASMGIRVSEVQFITVEALKYGRASIEMKGKCRIILIPEEICKKLLSYARQQGIKNGGVFVTKSGKPLDRSNIWRMLKNLCRDAGVESKKVFPHNLRHLFAKSFYSLHKDIVHLADILGHSSVNTTRIYTKDSIEIHRRQIREVALFRC